MKYQKEIQGLRALAVLAVIGHHLGIGALSGGFVGVDVFFVISGYLITGLLVREHRETGTIDLGAFYLRRVRRLFPALIVTCALTLLLGFSVLSDERFAALSHSAIAALLSVGNIYFWANVGYFDVEAATKPLLHMWSLGVEEQFYLVWPIVVVLLAGRRKGLLTAAIVVGSIMSLLLNAAYLDFKFGEVFSGLPGLWDNFSLAAPTAFYMMPFRVFEFGIGATAAVISQTGKPPGARFYNLIFCIGFAGILLAALHLDEQSVFPYWNALFVSLCTAAVIMSSQGSTLSSRLLACAPMVFIGEISYSLYLIHWPVIVYYRLLAGAGSSGDAIALFAVIMLMAVVMFKWVEQPLRGHSADLQGQGYWRLRSPVSAMLFISVLFLGTLSFGLLAKDFEDRVPAERQTLTNAKWRALQQERYCADEIPGYPREVFTCQSYKGKAETIVIWGDSHANHLAPGFAEVFRDWNIAVAYLSDCIPQSGLGDFIWTLGSDVATNACIDRNEKVIEWVSRRKDIAAVFVTSAKRDSPARMAEINNLILEGLRSRGVNGWVLGDFIRPGVELANCWAVPALVTDSMLRRICRVDDNMVLRELEYAKEMMRLSDFYVPLHLSQCASDGCRFVDDKGQVTFRDTHHLSVNGSIYEIRRVASLIEAAILDRSGG